MFDFQLLFCNGNEEECGDGNADLGLNRIERVTPEDLNFEMLFDPFEKEFNLPAMFVQVSDGLSRNVEVVGEVDIRGICFLIKIFYSS